MGIPLNELLGIIISDKFYVEKKPKAAIVREMGLSRNIVKKYIKLKWPEMAAKIAKNAEMSVIKEPEMTATPKRLNSTRPKYQNQNYRQII